MALTNSESAALMTNSTFFGRTKVAALRYADNITIQPVPASEHTSLLRYATQTFQSPDSVTQQLVPVVVMDSAVQDAGIDASGNSLVTDAALQGATEASVNKLYS